MSNLEITAEKTNGDLPTPVVFISYSWSTKDFQDRVTRLANFLEKNGVHVRYDQWEVKLGHSLNAFMQELRKADYVCILCDKNYQEKCNDSTAGGVLTESLLINPEVYKDVKQEKYIPVIMETDENGKPYLPYFLESRFYFDFANGTDSDFEPLLRHIFNKPALQRPQRGKPPELTLATTQTLNIPSNVAAIKELREGKPNCLITVEDFFIECIDALGEFQFPTGDVRQSYEVTFDLIKKMQPLRDNILSVLILMMRSSYTTKESFRIIREFFEKVYAFTQKPLDRSLFKRSELDNYAFFIRELYLYIIATSLKNYRFQNLPELYGPYILDERPKELQYFDSLIQHSMPSFEEWNQTLERRWISPQAEILKQYATRREVTWVDLVQADVALFVVRRGLGGSWLLPYVEMMSGSLPIFARAESKEIASELLLALQFQSVQEYKNAFKDDRLSHPKYSSSVFPIPLDIACNVERIGSR